MLNQFTTNKIIPRPGPTTDPAHLSQVLFWLLHPAGTEFITAEVWLPVWRTGLVIAQPLYVPS